MNSEPPLKFHDSPETAVAYKRDTSDYTSEEHFAVNCRGQVFKRTRSRGPRGYVNTAWHLTTLPGIPDNTRNSGRSVRVPR